MAFFDELGAAVIGPLKEIAVSFVYVLDDIIIAAILLVFGYLLGWLLGSAVRHALHQMKFDAKFKQLHLAKPLEKIQISHVIGEVVKWYTFIVLAAAGSASLNLYPVTNILSRFAEWFPLLVLALAIALFGAIVSEFIYKMVVQVHMREAKVIANLAKYFVLILFLVMALGQIVNADILEQVFLVLVGAVAIGLGLALGIAFGLALKDEAVGIVQEIRKK